MRHQPSRRFGRRLRLETLESRLAPAVLSQPGGFSNPAPLVVAGNSYNTEKQVLTADLDGDGVLDLVIANDQSVSLRRGLGGGAFEGTTDLPYLTDSGRVRSIAVGDLNADGAPDLAVAHSYVADFVTRYRVDVLHNDGSGGLTLATSFDLPQVISAFGLAIGDLTGEGRADLLVSQSSTLSTWRQEPDGSFALHSNLTGLSYTSFAVGDLDGDADLDVVVSDRYAGASNQVRLFANNGSGTFAALGSPITVGNSPTQIVLADLDSDGKPDFVTANVNASSLTVGWNDGGGSFSLLTLAVAAQTSVVGVGDFDGDGRLDLAGLVGSNAGGMSVWLNEGFQSFTSSRLVDVGGMASSAAFGDFDGDGTTDVAAAYYNAYGVYTTNAVFIRLAGPDGDFPVPGEVRVGDQPTAIAYGDFNADGIPDMVVTNFNADNVTVHLGDGNGGFNSLTPITVAVGDGPTGVAVGDLDGDGQADDFVVSNKTPGSVTVRRGNGNGTFTNATISGVGSPEAIALIDIDSDGDQDFVAVGTQIAWSLNNGAGVFGTALIVNPSTTLTSVAVGRVNTDSTPDIVVTNNTAFVRTYFNNSGAFTTANTQTNLGTGSFARGVALGDMDNDGDLDLAVANPGTVLSQSVGMVSVRLNTGGIFSGGGEFIVGRQPYAVGLGDLDGDGVLDLAVANGRNASPGGSASIIGSTVGIRRGNGDGSFSGSEALMVGDGPVALAIRDVNGDGLADLATANYDSDTASVRLNLGGLRFTGREDVISEGSPSFVVTTGPGGGVLDFNGDGHPDLVVASKDNQTVSVYFGDGSGRFTSWTTLAPFTTNYSPVAVVADDFDGDGFTDLAVASNRNNATEVQIRHGDGIGGFIAGVTRSITNDLTRALLGGDFDNDGHADLMVLHEVWSGGAGTAKYWFGNGMGDFQGERNVSVPNAPVQAASADLDNDGDLDVVLVHNLNPSPVHFLVNQDAQGGNRIISSGGTVYTFTGANVGLLSVTTGDLNEDGVLDVVVGSKTLLTASVLHGASSGAGNYSIANRLDLGVGRFPTALGLADLDGDGHLDIVSSAGGLDQSNTFNNDTVSVRFGNGDGSFTRTTEIQVGNNPTHLALADYTGDGLPEIVTANTGFGTYPAYTVSVRGGIVPTVTVSGGTVGYSPDTQVVFVMAEVTLGGAHVTTGDVTLTLKQGNTVIGTPITVPVSPTGVASGFYELPAGLAVGSYTLEADYTGRGANSSSGTLTVSEADSDISLSSNSATTYGDDVVLTATVTSGPGIDLAGMQVQFFRGANLIGSGTVVLVGAAFEAGYIVVGGLAAGTYNNLRAELVGTATVAGSVSALAVHVVNKKTLTVVADAKSKTYGQANPALTYVIDGLVGSDTMTGGLLTSAAVSSGVGSYAITKGTLNASANYTLNYTGAQLTIDPKALSVTAHTLNKVYGAALPTLTYTASGLVGSDTLSGALATEATAASDVGQYNITQGTLAASANYTLTFTAAQLTVTPAPLQVAADNLSKDFGEAVPLLTYHLLNSLVNDDTLAEVFSGELETLATAASLPGSYPISRGTLAANANYNLFFAPGTLSVIGIPIGSVTEDTAVSSGFTVASFAAAHVQDWGTTYRGIAVTVIGGSGRWQYSLNNGVTWLNLTTASDGSALLLRDTDRVRFLPGNWNGDALLAFHPWTRTGKTAGSRADTAVEFSGGSIGGALYGGLINVVSRNDAPVLPAAAPVLPPVGRNDTNPPGTPVDALLGGVVDPDPSPLAGIAVTALAGKGIWQYSLAGGAWTDFPTRLTASGPVHTVTAGTALLLRSTDAIRFVPTSGVAGKATISYRAWDQTSGTVGGTANLLLRGATGGLTAFSVAGRVASLAINDAPVLTPPVAPPRTLLEDTRLAAGYTVVSFVPAASISDADPVKLRGIAIVGLSGSGTWQFSTTAGRTWVPLTAASESNARLLRDIDRVRFFPAANWHGTASLTYRAWDRTQGVQGAALDLTLPGTGGHTSVSDATGALDLVFTPVNDAPVQPTTALTLPGVSRTNLDPAAISVAALLAGASDVDSGALRGVAIVGATGNGTWWYRLQGETEWRLLGVPTAARARLLAETAEVRFVPASGAAVGSATLRIRVWDQTTGSDNGEVNLVAASTAGGSKAFSLQQRTVVVPLV